MTPYDEECLGLEGNPLESVVHYLVGIVYLELCGWFIVEAIALNFRNEGVSLE